MDVNHLKYELQNLISGKSGASYDAPIQSVSHYLRSGERTGPMAEGKHQNKSKEEERLIAYAKAQGMLIDQVPLENYVSSGAEQKVYVKDGKHVLKLNDSIYYASWEDYFHNLLLHNYFFADTAYQLIGFHISEGRLHALVQQAYVKADAMTDLDDVKGFLVANGFENTKGHDYHYKHLGIIIEDLHDENVLTSEGLLYFIDTVFYIVPEEFWN